MIEKRELHTIHLNYTMNILTDLCPECESDTPYPYSISPREKLVRMKCPSCNHLFVRKIFNLKKEDSKGVIS